MLSLPPTIRIPGPNEMPGRPDLAELLEKRAEAKIIPGYQVKKNNTPQLPCLYIASVNVNNKDLWYVFTRLAALIPGEAAVEYGWGVEEQITTAYFGIDFILKNLARFEQEITKDATVSVGLLSHSGNELNEFIITECKYLQCWFSNLDTFEKIMKSYHLPNVPNLAFVDEYPKIIDPLQRYLPRSLPPAELMLELSRIFGVDA